MRLAMAHVDLAKAEATAIGGEVARVAALAAIAIVLVIIAAAILIIGTSLFLGEWLLGSMGWGILHGVEACLAVAMTCVVLAAGYPARRVGLAIVAGIAIGVLVALVLGFNLFNRLYAAIGDSLAIAVDPGIRPLLVGISLVGLIGLVVGIVLAFRIPAGAGGRFATIAGMTVAGVLLGALTAITYGPHVAAGIGIALGYVTWTAILAADVARTGIDVEALQARFYPTQTIETTKETLEWLQKRMPPGIG